MELKSEELQYIKSHGERKGGSRVLHWRVAGIVLGLCRSGNRTCGSCNCSDLIAQAGGNTIKKEYTPTKDLSAIRIALEQI